MSDKLSPFSTTGIGSMPYLDVGEAYNLIIKTFDIPFWPQLPKVSFKEQMIAQYSEGMPAINISEGKEQLFIDKHNLSEIQRFYKLYSDDIKIPISKDYASGLYGFLERLKDKKIPILKGHITGPLTFSLGLKDNENKPIYFDEELREISLMVLKAKAYWQIDLLKQYSNKVVIFIDEPIFSAIGTSLYLGVENEEVLRLLSDMVSLIEGKGGISGIHCCGKADWSLIIKSRVSIVSFDAFEYFDNLLIYSEDVKEFLQRGGYLAFGIVSTSESGLTIDSEQILNRLKICIQGLSKYIPKSLITKQMLLTPSCGTGSRTIEETIRIFELVSGLKRQVERYIF